MNNTNCASLNEIFGASIPEVVVSFLTTGSPVVILVAIMGYLMFGKEIKGVQRILILLVLAIFLVASAFSLMNLVYGMDQKLCPGPFFLFFF